CYLRTQIARTGSILFLMSLPMNYMFGWSIPTIIIVTGICVLIYSAMGGIKAVIYTDTVMGIILIAGALSCAAVLLFTMPEGPKQLFEIASEHHKFSLGSFSWSWTEPTFWMILIYGTFINLQNYGVDQNYVQRYLTTSSVREARNSTLFGGLLYVPVSLLFVFIGTALFSYYTAQPELLPEGISGDRVFPYFIINGLPQGVTGLLIAAIFAAGMSTVSTSVNSSATVVLTDFINRLAPKGKTEKRNMTVLYLTSALLGVLGVLVGLAMIRVQGVLDAWWKLSSIFSGGMLGLFLLGFIVKKARNPQALTGVIVGILIIAWMSLSPLIPDGSDWVMFRSRFHLNLTIVFGITAIFLVGFLLTLLAPKKEIPEN
ncbi:MAG: sodium:solute symporter, partial [Rikenellaceae bacterium]|nr:sodium:solute symporter [Rikenellaceae bacterium]